ncbi:MAG: DUF3857 domain-containing protein [Polaribacter sp.]|nr:DUF3857 domain-containing protein [Polaribacter sp.]
MKKLILVAFLLLQISVNAQDYKFSKVSKEELNEQFYPLDSSASAAYLYKYRRSYFDYVQNEGFWLVTEVHERIKIYNKEGFEYATRLVNIYTPDRGDRESVANIKAYTYYLENKKVEKEKLEDEGIFKEQLDDNYTQVKITMPKIKEGCVLEIRYKIYSPYAEYIGDVNFQAGIPIKKYQTQIEVPEYYVYKKISKGYFNIKMETDSKSAAIGSLRFSTDVFKFEGDNIPPLKNNEPFVSNADNYRGGVKFELAETDFTSIGGDFKRFSSSWESVSDKIYKSSNFGGELDKTSYFKKDVTALLVDAKSEKEKLSLIFQFVKTKVKWNGNYGKYASKGVKDAYEENVGNAADINLMLTAMLRFAGLKADPVLVSSRGNGVPITPTLNGFNYVISIVNFADNTYALLDATEPYSLPNVLPVRALNWNGRIVKEDGSSSWIKLDTDKQASVENIIMFKFTDDFVGEGMIRTKFENLSALDFRSNYGHIKEEDLRAKYEEANGIEIDEFKLSNTLELAKPVLRMVKFMSEDLVEEISGKLYIEPLIFLTQHQNPFKLEERKYPVDFDSPWKNTNRVSFHIPKGYKVESLPETLAIGLPNNIGVFKYQVRQVGNQIKAVSILEFNSSLISAQDYPYLKDFYGKLVDKQSEKIVLIKE